MRGREGHTDWVPEGVEVELYRRALASTVGERIVHVERRDELVVPDGDLVPVLTGRVITGARRHGKLLLMDTDGPVVGVHFGMTGRLVVGDTDPVGQLFYGPKAPDDGRWDRLVLTVGREGRPARLVRFSDPRRFGRVTLGADAGALGPDVWSVGVAALRSALSGRIPVKAALLDQHRLAGLGNMLADELLWRVGIDPARPCASLSDADVERLQAALVPMLDELVERGGSHAGELAAVLRQPGAQCPVDGEELQRRSIGGRTTWSCPRHQR